MQSEVKVLAIGGYRPRWRLTRFPTEGRQVGTQARLTRSLLVLHSIIMSLLDLLGILLNGK